ncbi:MAG TPA: AAA family ATPase [Planctomycetaceae bacterium]|nr:AAA family ATPase [Planctomycetaceae bacterium]HQZ63746.1 AAA family ATPase [Planctomycetaceae bacterium]
MLEAIFVGREALLQNVLEKIADAAVGDATHHVLLYGPRGIGKSHFTSLLHYRMVTDAKLCESVHIAWLNEDETTTSMVQLLVRIYRSLCKSYPDEYSAEWLDELLNQSPDEIAGVLVRRLSARFENRTLVILVENLNLLFENLGTKGQQALRSFLQEHPFACVIATSQQLFKAVTDRSEPFFGFFQQIQLKPLSLEDAQTLLVRIATAKGQSELVAFLNTPDGRGRVRAIHDLAGGNHRVYIVLSGFVTRESLDQLVAPFKKMADDLTPYYQERLRWVSPLQRQVVELLCRVHGTLNPKEIARRLLVDQGSVGKQMRILEEIGYLTSTKRGREAFYELSEPLMRLAYEVKEHSLLGMLIEFLRIWYRPEQMLQLRSTSLCPSTQAYIDAAYERSQTHPDPRLKLLQDEIEKAKYEGRRHELATLWEEKAAASNEAIDWFQAGYFFAAVDKEYAKAIDCFDKAIELDPKDAEALVGKGNTLRAIGLFSQSLDCYNEALSIDSSSISALTNKGNALIGLGKLEEALQADQQILSLVPEFPVALSNIAYLLVALDHPEEALHYLQRLIESQPTDAANWNAKALVHMQIRQFDEGLMCIDKGIELDRSNSVLLFNRAEILFSLHRWDEGFGAINDAFAQPSHPSDDTGDTASMFSLIFRLSEDEEHLQLRIGTLVDVYQQADEQQKLNGIREDVRQSTTHPLSHLADGLVKSLGKIDAERVTQVVLESYLAAVERRVTKLPEFEIALRLFRYGIRYLISGKESEFVDLIQPERRILRQALHLKPEN